MDNKWPCICGHALEDHDFYENHGKIYYGSCLVKDEHDQRYPGWSPNWTDDCGVYEPITNLDYMEKKYDNDNL